MRQKTILVEIFRSHRDTPERSLSVGGQRGDVTARRVRPAPVRLVARGRSRVGSPWQPSTPLTFRLRGSGSLSVPVPSLPFPSGLSEPEAKMAAAAAELVIGWCIFGLLLLVGEALRVLPGCGGGRRRAGQPGPCEPGELPRPSCSLLGPRGSPEEGGRGADSRGLLLNFSLCLSSEDVAGGSVWGRATLGVEKGVMALLGVRAASVPVSRALPWSLVFLNAPFLPRAPTRGVVSAQTSPYSLCDSASMTRVSRSRCHIPPRTVRAGVWSV